MQAGLILAAVSPGKFRCKSEQAGMYGERTKKVKRGGSSGQGQGSGTGVAHLRIQLRSKTLHIDCGGHRQVWNHVQTDKQTRSKRQNRIQSARDKYLSRARRKLVTRTGKNPENLQCSLH